MKEERARRVLKQLIEFPKVQEALRGNDYDALYKSIFTNKVLNVLSPSDIFKALELVGIPLPDTLHTIPETGDADIGYLQGISSPISWGFISVLDPFNIKNLNDMALCQPVYFASELDAQAFIECKDLPVGIKSMLKALKEHNLLTYELPAKDNIIVKANSIDGIDLYY